MPKGHLGVVGCSNPVVDGLGKIGDCTTPDSALAFV